MSASSVGDFDFNSLRFIAMGKGLMVTQVAVAYAQNASMELPGAKKF